MEYKNDWKEVKISDLGQIITGKTPSTKKQNNFGGSIPFLTPSDDMNVRYVETTARTLSQEGVNEVANKILPANSVCVSCIGSQLGKVVITTKETVTNQQINSIVPSSDVDTLFLYYLMLVIGNRLNYLSKTSTAVPIINKTEFSDIEMMLPAMHIQVKISSILSCLDSKIELNNKIIANLEAQAQTIFKSWFINFEPFQDGEFIESELGLIPAGWEIGKLGNSILGNLIGSGIEYFDDEKRYIATADVSGTEIINGDTWITFDERPSRANMQPKPLSLWFAKMKDSRKLIFVSDLDVEILDNMIFSTGFAGIQADIISISYLWTYLITDEFDRIKNSHCHGTTMQAINNENINRIYIVLPPENELAKFSDVTKPMFDFISRLRLENMKLAQIRDTLLPKLMSGEIDVSNIKIEPEEIGHV